jgi:SWI/SNF-related matrix-associated actin-dependent regulator of chromatin subfamily A3
MFTGRLIAPHQHTGTEWMLARERADVKGGIMADEMGLGKTIQTIFVIDANRVGSTLIIVPKSLKAQWIQQIGEFSDLRVFAYNGDGRADADDASNPVRRAVLESDITVASYERAIRSKVLRTIAFDRIVLDEAHRIRTETTMTRRNVDKIQGSIKWALTGTPIMSAPRDFASLLRWVGIDVVRMTPESMAEYGEQYMLRRTFDQLSSQCERLRLPPCRVNVHRVELSTEEKRIYNDIVRYAHVAIRAGDDAIHNGENRSEILQEILAIISKLQQLVVSPELIRGIIHDVSVSIFNQARHDATVDDVCPICIDTCAAPCRTACGHHFCESCLVTACSVVDKCPMCRARITPFSVTKHVSAPVEPGVGEGTSTKLAKVQDLLTSDGATKSIVFCHYTREVDLVAGLARQRGLPVWKLTGETTDAERTAIVDAFNAHDGKCVIVSNIMVGGVGLNLQTADTVIFSSLDWTPSLEIQAIARAHRLGCTNVVNVHRIVANGTIDEHVLRLQGEKLQHASTLFRDSKVTGKLGIDTSNLTNLTQLFALVM